MMDALKTSYVCTIAAYMAEKLGNENSAKYHNGQSSLALSHASAIYKNNNWPGQLDRWGTFAEYRQDAKRIVEQDLANYLK